MILIKAIYSPWNSCWRYLSLCSRFGCFGRPPQQKMREERKFFRRYFMILDVPVPRSSDVSTNFSDLGSRSSESTYLNVTPARHRFFEEKMRNSQSATDYHYLSFSAQLRSATTRRWRKLLVPSNGEKLIISPTRTKKRRTKTVNNRINNF